MLSVNASRLDRWLGPGEAEHISHLMRNWYGPPIAVSNVPGAVFAHPGGDFRGSLKAGGFASLLDWNYEKIKAYAQRVARITGGRLNAGFASFSDVIASASQGQRYDFNFAKVGATGVVGVTNSLWGLGSNPAAGANASNAPGGNAPTSATTGAFPFTNPAGSETIHFAMGYPAASVAGNTLLLYDRLFHVNKTMNTTAPEAVTGVPTRYQSSTASDPDYSAGNFLFVEVGGTALAATAHNWTVCQYTDQDGNTAVALPSLTGNSGAIVRRLDHPVNRWFAPLASDDTGIKALTQMQCSAAVATGVINFVIGHPLAWMPCPAANARMVIDGINSTLSLTRVFSDAALAFLEVGKPATTATNYDGSMTLLYR